MRIVPGGTLKLRQSAWDGCSIEAFAQLFHRVDLPNSAMNTEGKHARLSRARVCRRLWLAFGWR
jgi:hypothetical protein